MYIGGIANSLGPHYPSLFTTASVIPSVVAVPPRSRVFVPEARVSSSAAEIRAPAFAFRVLPHDGDVEGVRLGQRATDPS